MKFIHSSRPRTNTVAYFLGRLLLTWALSGIGLSAVLAQTSGGTVAAAAQATTTSTAATSGSPYAMGLTISGSGSIAFSSGSACAASCSKTFAAGSSVTLTATPAPGYRFSHWGGACTSASACTVKMDAAKSVTATFVTTTTTAVGTTLALTLAGSGGVGFSDGSACANSCSKTFAAGARITLVARPATGFGFTGWSGACSGTAACTLTMDTAKNVTASFAPDGPRGGVTLNVNVSGLGEVNSTPSGINCGNVCSANFALGSNVTLVATPAPGSSFKGWSGACNGTAPCTLTLNAAANLTAMFSAGATPGITDIVVENTTATEQLKVPVTFGQAFAPGDVAATDTLSAVRRDGTALPLQMDVKATHGDGSVRHAVLSTVLPRLAANETQSLVITNRAVANNGAVPTAAALIAAGFKAGISLDLNGQTYSASADEFLRSGAYSTWLSGPVAAEWLVIAPLKAPNGAVHPHLNARFAIRTYAGQPTAKVDVTVENNWAYEPGPQNFTYNANITVGNASVFTQTALTHFHHARWRKVFWWGAQPQHHLRHNVAYLLASKAVPNYDTSVIISKVNLDALSNRWASADKAPMGRGIVVAAMPMVGGRADIGPLTQWAATYLLTMDSGAKAATLGTGDLAGSWPIHYRDKLTNLPVTLKDFPYMTLLGRPGDAVNPVTRKSEAFPACGGDCSTAPTNYNPDSAHQPSLAYLPYLVTGEYFYLEELHFWANFNVLRANPYYRQFDKGLVKSDEVRGQAWSMRTLAETAYVTPDTHPLKGYFSGMVINNIHWYNTNYTFANPNQLGVLDGSGGFTGIAYTTPAGPQTGLAPWQDDFVTWSAGRLVELGFTDAQPLLAWKSKFPVGRMTAPGYCWIDGAVYALAVRPSAASPLYLTLNEAYQSTMRRIDARTGAAIPLVNSKGAKYLDQPCGSQAQADWRTQDDLDNQARRGPWTAGEMTGYATSEMGYPSNMQPALAVAADSGIANAKAAWTRFITRPVKPDYGPGPQWAIVPRN